jgi:FkbM family methyltransferase
MNIRSGIKSTLSFVHLLEPVQRFRARQRQIKYWQGLAKNVGISCEFAKSHIAIHRGRDSIRIASNHEIYLGDVIKYFDYYFSAVVPPGGARMVDYSRPGKHELAKSGLTLEFPSLPESDESTEIYQMHLKVPERGVVFDLGAYAGASACRFSMLVGPHGVVAAFEPDTENFCCLQRNLAAQGLNNVRAFQKGIWSSDTRLNFFAEGNMGSSVTAMGYRDGIVNPSVTIDVVTLETAAALAGVTTVHAIKMDIEGAELEVLRSAGQFLKRHRPRMVIEPHSIEGTLCTDALRTLLGGYGFATLVIPQGSIPDWPLVVAEPRL